MNSTFGGLNTVLRGLYASQTALDTVGHNVSNASTDGYSRQIVTLAATNPELVYTANGAMQKGTGVTVQSIMRARDSLVDQQMWKENSTLSYAKTVQQAMSKIEAVFNEPTDTGVQSVLNSFYQSWQTLATNAADDGTRAAVRERGVELVNAVQHAAQQFKDQVKDINSSIATDVSSINETTAEIASLNKQIANIEATGTDHANDLRDKRDLLVDKLSALTKVSVTEDDKGMYIVQSANTTLVNGTGYVKLSTTTTKDTDYGYDVTNVVDDTGRLLSFSSGEIKGSLDARDSTQSGIKGYLNNLSSISQFFQSDFNAVHRNAYGTDNSTDVNFFGNSIDPAGNGTTMYQQSTQDISANFTTWPAVAAGDDLTIKDDAGNTLTVNLGTLAAANPAPPANPLAVLANYINTNAPTQSPPANVRASYDSTTGKFALYTTGSSTQLTVSATAGNATNFLNNLRLADPPKSYWLDNMAVNQKLFDPTSGLAEIAAKTAPNAGSITVTNKSGTVGSAVAAATGTYTGTTPASVLVNVVNAAGDIQYSTDGGASWSSSISSNGSTPPQYTMSINGASVTMQITSGANGDQYSFSLSSANTTSLTVTQSNSAGGIGTITSATGIYTKGSTATSVKVQLNCTVPGTIASVNYYTSTDGGTTWSSATNIAGSGPTYTMTINGVTVNLNIPANTNNANGDQYNFTLSNGNVASGDNAVLLSNRLKLDTVATLGQKSLNDYYAAMISNLGVDSQDAQRLTNNQQSVVDQITNWRQSVSGVNMDEEMTNMIKFQKGYSAAARVLTTMDSMLDTLINSTGMVGR